MQRRTQIVEAALLVVADGGLKGLTHRAIDARAGLPEGSTGNVFPRRVDLVREILIALETRDLGAFDSADGFNADTPADLAVVLVAGIERMISDEYSALTKVRFTMMQAYPAEVEVIHCRFVKGLSVRMSRCGITEPEERARTVAGFFDGVLFHQLSVDPHPLNREGVTRAVEALLVA